MEKKRSRDPVCTIKGTPYDIDEKYFVKIMRDLGRFLCKRYRSVDLVSPLEVMSQVAYIRDLTIQQKMYIAYFMGSHSDNMDYEGYILACMEDDNEY